MVERDMGSTISFLTDALGFRKIGEESSWQRYGVATRKRRDVLLHVLDMRKHVPPDVMLICVPCSRRPAAHGERAAFIISPGE